MSDVQEMPQGSVNPELERWLQWLFGYRGLTVRQKILAIAQKYYVQDETGQPRFFVVRPPKIFGYMVANLVALATSITFLLTAIGALRNGEFLMFAVIVFIGGNVANLLRVLLVPYRDINVYTDESETFPVLYISQDNKFGFYHRFTIYDLTGEPIAVAKRNLFLSFFRRRWVAETIDGRPICRIVEDTLALSVIRRYIGPLFGMLRTNFDVQFPDGTHAGEYNRSLTLYDQYVLNLEGDQSFLIDRRVLLAIAILLDTGEGR